MNSQKLATWLEQNGHTPDSFALAMGRERTGIYRILAGKRMPREDLIKKIYVFTGGAVDPNSFYDLPELANTVPRATAQPECASEILRDTGPGAPQSEAA